MIQKQHESKLEVGQTFPVTIKRLGINGEGVGYFKRQVVLFQGITRRRSCCRNNENSAWLR